MNVTVMELVRKDVSTLPESITAHVQRTSDLKMITEPAPFTVLIQYWFTRHRSESRQFICIQASAKWFKRQDKRLESPTMAKASSGRNFPKEKNRL